MDPSYPLCIPGCYKDVLKISVRWGFLGTFYYLYKGVWNLYLYGLMGDGDSDGVESPAGWGDDMDPRPHLLRQHHFFSITFNDSCDNRKIPVFLKGCGVALSSMAPGIGLTGEVR